MRSSPSDHPSSQQPLSALVKVNHPLVQLANALDWTELEQEFATLAPETGRPALPVRLMVGLHYLKTLYHESDESVVEKWIENPYWQYFCGEQFFQHEFPCHPTSLVKWRKRVGANGVECLLKQILKTAIRYQAIKANELKCVTVDTTVQEKAIAFPTDAKLYDKARKAVVKAARSNAVKLRQTYARLGRQALLKQAAMQLLVKVDVPRNKRNNCGLIWDESFETLSASYRHCRLGYNCSWSEPSRFIVNKNTTATSATACMPQK